MTTTKINIGNIATAAFYKEIDDILEDHIPLIEEHFGNTKKYISPYRFRVPVPSFLKSFAETKIKSLLTDRFDGISVIVTFIKSDYQHHPPYLSVAINVDDFSE